LEAFQTYLMARQYYITGNMTDTRKSDIVIRLARRAIELDPDYARAWAMLAVAQRMQAYSGSDGDNGLAAAERALTLDASVVDAYGVKIGALISARAYEEARAAIDVALALDPDSYEVHKEAARLAFMEHRFADAVRHYEKASSLAEAEFSATGLLMSCYSALGDKAGTRSAAERTLARTELIIAREPDNGSALSMGIGALAYLGQVERAKEWSRRALLLDPDNLNMRYNIACAMILDLGELEAGLDMLEPAIAKFGKDRLAHAKSDPDFDAVRDHPRFKAMIAAAEARLAGATG